LNLEHQKYNTMVVDVLLNCCIWVCVKS